MSDVWFTSDLHLGHRLAAEKRGFASVAEHDVAILDNIAAMVGKRDKLFVLGDVAFDPAGLLRLAGLPGVKELIFGNHDRYVHRKYTQVFTRIHGFRKYNGFWLSHCPVHSQELYRVRGNVHGHIHRGAATPPLPLPYFNVNVDFHDMKPVNFDEICSAFSPESSP